MDQKTHVRMAFHGKGKIVAAAFALVVLCAWLSSPATAQTFSVFYTFTPNIGAGPEGDLVGDGQGNLYGTSSYGGFDQAGTIYEIDTHGTPKLLYSFTGQADGGEPGSGMVRDAAGNLYGSTFRGGILGGSCPSSAGCGVVFKLGTSGKLTVLHAFTGGADGWGPFFPSFTLDGAGNLYGVTGLGGNYAGSCAGIPGCGVVFRISLAGKFAVLYTFNGLGDGSLPRGTLVRDHAGNLYGVASNGGIQGGSCPRTFGCGVIFKLDNTGKETILYSFTGGSDGTAASVLVADAVGNLYGGTDDGGTSKLGTLFKLNADGSQTVLYDFTCNSVCGPDALTLDRAGNFYGVSGRGDGTVFKLDKSGNLTLIHAFTGGSDGVHPGSGLLFDTTTHTLFGTTFFAGNSACGNGNGCGVVYQVKP
jgi:uncharacterized repeat protein (TIGR03803 family)